VPEPEEEFVAEEILGLGAFGGPGIFGVMAVAAVAKDEACGAEVFVIASPAAGFQDFLGQGAGGKGVQFEFERALEEFHQLFSGRGRRGGINRFGGEIPEYGRYFAAAKFSGADFLVDLLGQAFPDGFFLLFGDKSGGIGGRDCFLLHELICQPQFGGDAIGIDADGEGKSVVEDIAVEIESVVENMPATGPAVFDLCGGIVLARGEFMAVEGFKKRFIDGFGQIAGNGKTTHGD